MGLYSKLVLPRVIDIVCGMKPQMRQRRKVVPNAEGRVLDIGFGTGLNAEFYAKEKVNRLWALDPSAESWKLAKDKVEASGIETEYLQTGAESIPLDDGSIDTIVVTYSLCTIPDRPKALGEMKRVLTDSGRLLFCEHGAAPDAGVRRWQNVINPIWKIFSGGCYLNIDIPALLDENGFAIEALETMYLPGFRPASFNYWGSAR